MRITTLAALAAMTACPLPAVAQSNIDPAHKLSWSETAGWMNWLDADAGAQGVVVREGHLSGRIWGENAGWISVGAPGGGPYANTNGTDYGVNIVGPGWLVGYAWGENVGWINFDTRPVLGADGARFDASAQRFFGWAWSENAGWINLDDDAHYVAVTGSPCPTDLDGDGDTDGADLAQVLGAWGPNPGHPADLDMDGDVDGADLAQFLGSWGACD